MSLLTTYLPTLLMALASLSHAAPRPALSSSLTSAPARSALLTHGGDVRVIELELDRFQRLTSFMTDLHDLIGIPPGARTDEGYDRYEVADVKPDDLRLLPTSYNHSSQVDETVVILAEEIIVQCGIPNGEGSEWVRMMRCAEEEAAVKTYLKNLQEYGFQIGVATDALRTAPPMQLGTYRCIRSPCSALMVPPASVTVTEVPETTLTRSFVPSRSSLGAPEGTQTPSPSHQKWSSNLNVLPRQTTNPTVTRTQPSTLITAMSKPMGQSDLLGSKEVEHASHRLMPRVMIEIDDTMSCVQPPSTWKLTYNTWISFVWYTVPNDPARRGTSSRPPPPTGPWTPPWVTNSHFATLACRSVWADAFNGLAGSTSVNVYTVEW
jgi:hypothetical protein